MSRLLIWLSSALKPFFVLALLLACLLVKNKRKELIWGPIPIINNKYWSHAMRAAGWNSITLMLNYYSSINKREDYDLLFKDLVPGWIFLDSLRSRLASYFAMLYTMRNGSVVHLPFSGGPLGSTRLWRWEAGLFRWAGIKSVVMAYGADAYMYSRVQDPSLRHGLLQSYPLAAPFESEILRRVEYWNLHADAIICGYMTDGMARWDVPVFDVISIDVDRWKPKTDYSSNNGTDGPVRIIHTPNHRGFKGTEFLLNAIEELRAEGLQIELILLERIQNDEVRELMQRGDILAEQFIATGYALSAIEGMATGLPVMSNLENEAYTRMFRRYSYLNECPIVSTAPETIKSNLRALITNPDLRAQLGAAGRQYVEKYHSYETAQYLFGAIYDKILNGRDVDLMNLFHPLKSEYNKRRPAVEHPLLENRLPKPLVDRELNLAGGSRAPSMFSLPPQ